MIGDSLAGPLGNALAPAAAATEVAGVRVDFEGGTGLASAGFFDWFAFVRENLPGAAPDVVIVTLGANDGQAMMSPEGWVEFGTADWDAGYRALVGGFMDLLSTGSARVYWAGMPIMAVPGYDARIRHLNALLREEAALRLEVRFIDAYALFQGPDGRYTDTLADENGNPATVRASDGIHYTPAGAQRLARRIMEILAAEWSLPGAGA